MQQIPSLIIYGIIEEPLRRTSHYLMSAEKSCCILSRHGWRKERHPGVTDVLMRVADETEPSLLHDFCSDMPGGYVEGFLRTCYWKLPFGNHNICRDFWLKSVFEKSVKIASESSVSHPFRECELPSDCKNVPNHHAISA